MLIENNTLRNLGQNESGSVRDGFDRYDLYLAKPCSPRELVTGVDRLVQGRNKQAPAATGTPDGDDAR